MRAVGTLTDPADPWVKIKTPKGVLIFILVGAAGFEPTLAESESDVLPLNYAPKKLHVIIYTLFRFSIKFFMHINVANVIFVFYDFYYDEKGEHS